MSGSVHPGRTGGDTSFNYPFRENIPLRCGLFRTRSPYTPGMGSRSEIRWLDTEQQESWRAYIMGTELLQHQLDRELREEHEISFSEYEILVRLSETEGGRMRMALLADAMSHSRSRVTHTIARMEKADLVLRQASEADGRGVEAVMTEAGRAKLFEAAPTHVRGVRKHLVDIASRSDFAAIGRIFNEVSDRLLEDKPKDADIR
jgi:DNA-binding MarR family transcriptional regulator